MINYFKKVRLKLLFDGKLQNYLKYAAGEIILVVVGILIALQINNWSESIKNRELESVYLREMLEDFKSNLQKSEDTIEWINEVIPEMIVLLEQSSLDKPDIPVDSLNYNFSSLLTMPTYNSTDRVYQNLIGSGDFKIITSRNLKNDIANYYKAVDLIELVQRTHEMELVNSIQPYIIDNMDFQSVGVYMLDDWDMPPADDYERILKVMKSREFRNIIVLKLSILSDLLEQNENIKEINKKLVASVEKHFE